MTVAETTTDGESNMSCEDDDRMHALRGIVERVMTLHHVIRRYGDMAACKCWLCEAGRSIGCHAQPQYLEACDEIRDGLATGK